MALAVVCVDKIVGCVCVPPFTFTCIVPKYVLTGICESDMAGTSSHDSDMPESVTIDDSSDDGSISIASICFFFVNEPHPDEVIDVSSLIGPLANVFTVDVIRSQFDGAIVVDGKLDGGEF